VLPESEEQGKSATYIPPAIATAKFEAQVACVYDWKKIGMSLSFRKTIAFMNGRLHT
jgi:hypothetical protein